MWSSGSHHCCFSVRLWYCKICCSWKFINKEAIRGRLAQTYFASNRKKQQNITITNNVVPTAELIKHIQACCFLEIRIRICTFQNHTVGQNSNWSNVVLSSKFNTLAPFFFFFFFMPFDRHLSEDIHRDEKSRITNKSMEKWITIQRRMYKTIHFNQAFFGN